MADSKVKSLQNFYDDFWNSSLQVLAHVERTGMAFDSALMERKAEHASEVAFDLHAKLNAWAFDYTRQREAMNWNSTQQVAEFLYDFKCYPIPAVVGTMSATKKNRDDARSTSEASLDWLCKNHDQAIQVLLDYKRVTKLQQFMEKLPTMVVDGRLHCSLGPKTDTGRLTSSKPNMQQIPTRNDRFKMRECFVAPPGYRLIVADYSQLEMYVMAHFLVELFDDHSLAKDLAHGDVHTNTAYRLFGDQLAALGCVPNDGNDLNDRKETKRYRSEAKTIN